MPDTSESNPLGIRMICEHCGRAFPRDCLCNPSRPSAHLPLRHVPESVLEEKRAELLEFNSTEGLRKLTDEERLRMSEAANRDTPEEEAAAQAEEPPWAEPADLLPGEGFG